MRRPGVWRPVAAVVLALVLYVVLALLDFDPDPLRLGLLVLVCAAAAALLIDTFDTGETGWDLQEAGHWTMPVGQDQGFSAYLHAIEHHLTVDVPDGALRDRLAGLAALRLEQRHGLVLGDPRADDLLGPELSDVLSGPPRRLSRAEIDRCVRRMEEL
jgi:hypothetical protein